MTINLKDFVSDKEVIVTFQNGVVKRGYVIRNNKRMLYPYAFSGRGYYYDGSTGIGYHDMIDIRFLEDGSPEPKPNMNPKKKTFYVEPEIIDDMWNCSKNYQTFAKNIISMVMSSFDETPEPKPNMNPNKSDFYNSLSAKEQALYDVTKDEVSAEWVESLEDLIIELGGEEEEFDLIFWSTPEEAVNVLRKRIETLKQLAADEELDACEEFLSCQLMCTNYEYLVSYLRQNRRPEKTLKQKALEDLKSLKELATSNPEILDNIEKALNSLSDSTT